MTIKELAKRIVHHVFAWVLLLAIGIAGILGGIFLVGSGYWSSLIIRPSDATGTENVVFFLLELGIGFGIYLIDGVTSGVWKLSVGSAVSVIAVALILLAFGEVGLLIVGPGITVLLGCAWWFLRARNRDTLDCALEPMTHCNAGVRSARRVIVRARRQIGAHLRLRDVVESLSLSDAKRDELARELRGQSAAPRRNAARCDGPACERSSARRLGSDARSRRHLSF